MVVTLVLITSVINTNKADAQKVEINTEIEREAIEEIVEEVLDRKEESGPKIQSVTDDINNKEEYSVTEEEHKLMMELVNDELARRKEEDRIQKEEEERYKELNKILTPVAVIYVSALILVLGWLILISIRGDL